MAQPALRGLAALRENERDARRTLIMDAACRLFAEKDFRQVTVREIARQAEVAVGTIYNYYASLDELFFDIFLKHAREIEPLLSSHAGKKPPTLHDLCVLYVDYLYSHIPFYQIMSHFMLGGDLSPGATEKLNNTMRTLLDRLETALKKTGAGADSRVSAHALFAALNGIMISYARYPGRSDDQIRAHTRRLAGRMADIFARAHGG
ncbi:MAG: TetR/AcrR family transcriptional regulator [Thermodesulfobacteriota bacterium]